MLVIAKHSIDNHRIIMHSYIEIHHLSPKPKYYKLDKLKIMIDEVLFEQSVISKIDEVNYRVFRDNIIECMEIYYKLVGINDNVIEQEGRVAPAGLLPRFTKSLVGYFRSLEGEIPDNDEMKTLRYSGLNSIKIRYKYTDSVIKKIIKLGLRDSTIFDDPLKIFLKGGALHDLIGIQFVCSYPYEKEWLARSLYNFFEYEHRTDDHLIYGFYTVKKKSGYRGLHCDNTLFNPRFDYTFSKEPKFVSVDLDTIFDAITTDSSDSEVLRILKDYFNIEIQIHTTFENLWATMEHTKSYNIQAKGRGRNSEITVQWKLLSDTMHNLEQQFEQLQIDTEQAQFKSAHHKGYTFVNDILKLIDSDMYEIYISSINKVYSLEDILKSHEISRHEYVEKLYEEAEYIYNFAQNQKNLSVKTILLLHSSYIYYGLTTYREYFNDRDIKEFVKKAQDYYHEIDSFLNENKSVFKGNLLNIIAVIRYLYLEHKHGLGLMMFDDKNYDEKVDIFLRGLTLLNDLNDDDLHYLKEDNASYLKIIHSFDTMAREWELFDKKDIKNHMVREAIRKFRAYYVNISLELHFQMLLGRDKITNVGLVVKFYTALIWHGIIFPIDGLREIIKYSAYDRIERSDLFYYELSAYRFLMMCCCGDGGDFCLDSSHKDIDPIRIVHLQNYHKENMIQHLYRIERDESAPEFEKAKLYFEQLTGSRFQVDHFSDRIPL